MNFRSVVVGVQRLIEDKPIYCIANLMTTMVLIWYGMVWHLGVKLCGVMVAHWPRA